MSKQAPQKSWEYDYVKGCWSWCRASEENKGKRRCHHYGTEQTVDLIIEKYKDNIQKGEVEDLKKRDCKLH